MTSTKEQLAAEFQNLSNKELLRRVDAGTLTPVAHETAVEELGARGVKMPEGQVPSDEISDVAGEVLAALPDGVGLVTLVRIINPLQGSILRAHLESEGLFAYLWGEHLGTANILFSMATGGMQLQVRSDQLQRAREVMAAFEDGDYSLDNDFESQ